MSTDKETVPFVVFSILCLLLLLLLLLLLTHSVPYQSGPLGPDDSGHA
jgi:hypothetical protein